MNLRWMGIGCIALVALSGSASAQPRIVTVNPNGGTAVNNTGTIVYGSATRFDIGSGSMTVTPLPGSSISTTVASDDGLFAAGTVGGAASRYSLASGTWTTLPFAAPLTALSNVRDISSTGQFIVGQASATGGFSGWVWNAASNTSRRLLGNTTTARAMAVSQDGSVIVGGESPNVAGTTSGGRPGVWRFNADTDSYDWSYLPDGPIDGNGATAYRTVDNFHINDDGNIIIGTSFLFDANTNIANPWLTRWVWNPGTQTWDRFNLYNMNTTTSISSWWTPLQDCPIPPQFIPTGMTDDGNTIIGQLVYSTCGSFYRAGFLFINENMEDLSDFLVEQGVDLATAGYGTFFAGGIGGSHLGAALDISDDGLNISGQPILDPDAPGGWLIQLNAGGSPCISAVVATNPTPSVLYSACTSSIILNASGAGTPPFSIQWQKDGGSVLASGPTGNGSTYQILANGAQLRINGPLALADAGNYTATVVNACGMATSTPAVVAVEPAFAIAPNNDNCSGADLNIVTTGTNVLGAGATPCSAWENDPAIPFCSGNIVKADRWYRFDAPASADYRFETCGANYDTILSIYDVCDGVELACNNDRDSGSIAGCAAQRSRIDRIALTAGTSYYIRIGAPLSAFLSNTNLMNLSIIAAPSRAPNDDCSNAIPAIIGANPINTDEATSDGGASCSPPGLFRDVWFTYSPTAPGFLRAATCPGTTWNTVLTVFDGCFGNELACNDNANVSGCFNQSIIEDLRVTTGSTYYIRVGGNSATAFGTGVLTLGFFCIADYNRDGIDNSQDFFDFIIDFFAGDADFNVDGTTNSQDFFDFTTAFFAGC